MDIDSNNVPILVDSVSGGDAESIIASSVSSGDAVSYIINLYMTEESTQEVIEYTIWDKPIADYTVGESLLLLLVVVALIALVWSAVKGGFKWLI